MKREQVERLNNYQRDRRKSLAEQLRALEAKIRREEKIGA